MRGRQVMILNVLAVGGVVGTAAWSTCPAISGG